MLELRGPQLGVYYSGKLSQMWRGKHKMEAAQPSRGTLIDRGLLGGPVYEHLSQLKFHG